MLVDQGGRIEKYYNQENVETAYTEFCINAITIYGKALFYCKGTVNVYPEDSITK